MNESVICRRAVETYGTEHQKRKAMEELAELMLALSREQDNRSTDDEVITEIADVQIMLEQLMQMYGREKVTRERYRKLRRLEARIRRCLRDGKPII